MTRFQPTLWLLLRLLLPETSHQLVAAKQVRLRLMGVSEKSSAMRLRGTRLGILRRLLVLLTSVLLLQVTFRVRTPAILSFALQIKTAHFIGGLSLLRKSRLHM